jgi:hypothetical protein
LGALLHVDLANRSSCIAIQTEDLGLQAAEGLVLLGREVDAPPRGCSLDAETLSASPARALVRSPHPRSSSRRRS